MSVKDWNPPRISEPAHHLSAGRLLTPQRYVVGWPDGVIKIGSTCHGRQRWGRFINRGGTMIDLANYANLIESLEGEIWLQREVEQVFPPAFSSKEEAHVFLGNHGAGWLECYAVDPKDWPLITEMAGGVIGVV